MRDRAFLSKSNPPKRGVFLQCALATTSFVMVAGCANPGSGGMGASLGGDSNSRPKPAVTASAPPTWSNNNGSNATGGTGSTGSMPIVMLTSPIKQATTATITAIVPFTSMLTSATQTLGAATGLGAPVSNVLATLGGALGSEGRTISTAGKGDGLVSTLGNTVGAPGSLTTGLSVVVSPTVPSAVGGAPGGAPGSALTGALGGVFAPVTMVVGPLTAGLPGVGAFGSVGVASSGGMAVMGPLSGLSGVGTTVDGLVGGALSGVVSGTHHQPPLCETFFVSDGKRRRILPAGYQVRVLLIQW